MLKTIGAISVFLMASVVLLFITRRDSIKYNLSLFIYLMDIFLFETLALVTSSYGIKNHIYFNINNLLYYPVALWLVISMVNHIVGRRKINHYLLWGGIGVICGGWVLENFVFGRIWQYSGYLPSICSMILLLVVIYLINQLLFLKVKNIFQDPDGLVMMGLLMRFFSTGLIWLFFNLRWGYSAEFYANLITLALSVTLISDIFFLIAVLWLPRRKKYTWPF